MSKTVPVVNTASGKFQDLYTAVNSLITTLNTETVTANSAAAGGLTIGNCMISGTLGTITLAANTFRGGTVAVSTPITLGSNLSVNTSFSIISGNTVINATAIAVGANVVMNTSALHFGNSIVNSNMNSSSLFVGLSLINATAVLVGNTTVFGALNATALYIQNTTTTTVISPGGISVGNSVVNASFGSGGVDPSDLTFITFGDATANLYANSSVLRIANTISSANLTPTLFTLGASRINATAVSVGNSVSNLVINSSGFAIDGIPAGAFSTGDAKITLKTVADASWVMMNDGTIGDASSGATTRANADCLALFTLLWTNISNTYAPVTGGRGASALADWNAHKRIGLIKVLGRALATAGAGAGLTGRELGSWLGEETHAMSLAEMPTHSHTYSDPGHNHTLNDPTHNHSLGDPGHAHGVADPTHVHYNAAGGATWVCFESAGGGIAGGEIPYNNISIAAAYTGIGIYGAGTGQFNYANYSGTYNSAAVTGITIQAIGGSTPFNVMQPSVFWNVMIKL